MQQREHVVLVPDIRFMKVNVVRFIINQDGILSTLSSETDTIHGEVFRFEYSAASCNACSIVYILFVQASS